MQDGGGGAVATTNGVDVTPSNVITIALGSTAGVKTWTVSCIGTDDSQVQATINAGLTINAGPATATYTCPVAGTALIFQSTVVDVNGVTSSTTFGVYTKWFGKRVGALGEGTEGSAAYGWVLKNNAVVRGEAVMSLLADFASTTALTAQNTNLTFAVAANDVWLVEFAGDWSVASGVAGANIAVNAPAGATIEGVARGETSSSSAFASARITAAGTLVGPFNTAAATVEDVRGAVRVKMGATPGAVTLQVAPAAAVVLTLKAGFWLRARKIVEV